MVGAGEVTPSTWDFASNWPHWSEIADSQLIFARSTSAVTPCKKRSFNTRRQSCRAFIGLTVRAKMVGEERPIKRKFCIK